MNVALLLAAAACAAGDAPPERSLAIEAATDFPVHVGGRVELRLPYRLRLSGTLGVTPDAYVRFVNDVAVENDAYDRETADLIEDSLQRSLALGVHAGWRPFGRLGLEVAAGYGLLALAGTSTTVATLSAVTGVPAPPLTPPGDRYTVEITVHTVHAEVGWRFESGPATLRLAVGWAAAFAAPSKVEAEGAVLDALTSSFVDDVEAELSRAVEDGFRAPTLSLSAGFLF